MKKKIIAVFLLGSIVFSAGAGEKAKGTGKRELRERASDNRRD